MLKHTMKHTWIRCSSGHTFLKTRPTYSNTRSNLINNVKYAYQNTSANTVSVPLETQSTKR